MDEGRIMSLKSNYSWTSQKEQGIVYEGVGLSLSLMMSKLIPSLLCFVGKLFCPQFHADLVVFPGLANPPLRLISPVFICIEPPEPSLCRPPNFVRGPPAPPGRLVSKPHLTAKPVTVGAGRLACGCYANAIVHMI